MRGLSVIITEGKAAQEARMSLDPFSGISLITKRSPVGIGKRGDDGLVDGHDQGIPTLAVQWLTHDAPV
jgi:hypothetical protein